KRLRPRRPKAPRELRGPCERPAPLPQRRPRLRRGELAHADEGPEARADLSEELRGGRLYGAVGHRQLEHPRTPRSVQSVPNPARAPPAENPRPEGGAPAPRARGFPALNPGEAPAPRIRRGCRRDAPRRDCRDGVPPHGQARPAYLRRDPAKSRELDAVVTHGSCIESSRIAVPIGAA